MKELHLDYKERRKQAYEELDQAERELKESVLDNNDFVENFKAACQSQDKFKMFELLSGLIDDNAELVAKVAFLDFTKDLAHINDITFEEEWFE